MSVWDQIIMYCGVLLGVVLVQPSNNTSPRFEKLSVRPDAPFVVRLGLFVQTGVFWQVIIVSIGKGFVGG